MKFKNELKVFSHIFFIMIGLACAIFGVYLISTGYLIFDYGHNLHHIELLTDITAYDMLTNGVLVTPPQLLMMGFAKLRLGIILSILGMFFLGYEVAVFELLLIENFKKKK